MSDIKLFRVGDEAVTELESRSMDDLEKAKPLIIRSYEGS